LKDPGEGLERTGYRVPEAALWGGGAPDSFAPMAEPSPRASAGWRPLVYFWEGGWIGIGRSAGVVAPHTHHAVQISIGLDGPIGFRHPDEEWQVFPAAAVLPNVPHGFNPLGSTAAMIFVEPESREGRWLRNSLRTPITGFAEERLEAHLAGLRSFRDDRPSAEEAARMILGVVHALCAGPPPLKSMDPRISKAMAVIRGSQDGRLSLEQVAAAVFLSPSRFAHLFSEEVGLPFRRYLLWRKLNRALSAFGRGLNLSEAAHAAGFADSAHLSRTWTQMFGIPPTMMAGGAEFYEIPAQFALGE